MNINQTPNFSFENTYNGIVFGLDEVGRGPLAGDVVAAAVYIPPESRNHPIWSEVKDSKKLTKSRREILFPVIKNQCIFAIKSASVDEIDKINILQATFLAMYRAVNNMNITPDHLIIDGNRTPKNWPWSTQSIIKGDSKSVSIAAASILAKVTRDNIMCELSQIHPEYGWDKNSGYGTSQHLCAIKTYGITMYHRKSFAPIKNF